MYILQASSISDQVDIDVNHSLTLGRGDKNDIVIKNPSISINHAKIHLENNKIYLEDLDSSNGTFIGDHQLEPNNQYELNSSQSIRLGEITYILKEQSKSNDKPVDKEFTVGRSPQSDIFINVDTVSSTHLIVREENDDWYIADNNSTNGTYLGSYDIDNKIDKIKLEPNQKIYLASYKLNSNDILNLINDKKSQTTLVNSNITTLGRDPSSNVHIKNINVSWNHAKIIYENSAYYIYDLNSSNGTFVNDIQIDKKQEIFRGDNIVLGVYNFIFQHDKNSNLSLVSINQNGFTIDAKNIFFKIFLGTAHEKTLLTNINFTVYPGEIVGLMGLSGAGKTTLLKILSGYIKPTEGNVFVNGLDLYNNFDRIKNSIGYVPQEDIIHPELTVYEALYYSLKLRAKEKLSMDEVNQKIDTILEELGLSISGEDDIRRVKIGSPDDKGTSGGQRKRINIAMELLADPEIIFLDEPTSGLSSVDATVVMDKLKELADKGKTIILTIHQPSLINYKKMDDMIVLTRGELAYFGPNYPDSIKFFNNNTDSQEILSDPDRALLGLHSGEGNNINWSDEYLSSEIHEKFVKERSSSTSNDSMSSHQDSTSLWTQLTTLTARYLKIKIKDRVNTAILLIQAPVIAVLLVFLFSGSGLDFHKEHPNILLFILVISSMWFGIINSVKEIVSEKAIYERERLIGLKLIPYILSKFLVLSILSLIQVITLLLIVKAFIPIELQLLDLLVLIFVTALSGVAIGLLTSVVAKSVSQALSLVPIILLPMIIFGGGMIPINKLASNASYLDAYRVSFLMPTRWSLEEAIRILDRNDTDELREPLRMLKLDKNNSVVFDENNSVILIPNYTNTEVAGARKKDALCEERRCVEELYIKQDTLTEIWTFRTTSTNTIYIILSLFILVPLLLVIFILYRRDKSKRSI